MFKQFGQAEMRGAVNAASEIPLPLLDATGTFRPELKNVDCLDREAHFP
jgi:hypothetical protein